MIFCTKCGRQIREDADYCPYCGNQVANKNVQMPEMLAYNAGNRRKSNSMLIPGIIIAILIILLGSAYFFKDYAINKYYMYQSGMAVTLENKIELNIDAIKAKYTETAMENFRSILLNNASGDKDLAGYIDKLKASIPQAEYKDIEISYYTARSQYYFKDKKYEDALYCLTKARISGYTITSDKNYEGIMMNLAYKISGCQTGLTRKQLNQAGVEYGDLDNDGIDEIVVFTKTMDGEYFGHQVVNVYKFTDHSYTLLDKQDCNYVENVVDAFIAPANSKQKMIFLTGCAGAHAGYSVNYALQNGKLVASSDPIYSVYPMEPKDVDNDGYFEVPCEDIDPESPDQSNAGSDKIITWYKIKGINNLVIAKQESVKANH